MGGIFQWRKRLGALAGWAGRRSMSEPFDIPVALAMKSRKYLHSPSMMTVRPIIFNQDALRVRRLIVKLWILRLLWFSPRIVSWITPDTLPIGYSHLTVDFIKHMSWSLQILMDFKGNINITPLDADIYSTCVADIKVHHAHWLVLHRQQKHIAIGPILRYSVARPFKLVRRWMFLLILCTITRYSKSPWPWVALQQLVRRPHLPRPRQQAKRQGLAQLVR